MRRVLRLKHLFTMVLLLMSVAVLVLYSLGSHPSVLADTAGGLGGVMLENGKVEYGYGTSGVTHTFQQ